MLSVTLSERWVMVIRDSDITPGFVGRQQTQMFRLESIGLGSAEF